MIPLIDVHTHVYLPRYASWLRSRSIAPRILVNEAGEERLFILENETSAGRPVGPSYWDRDNKLNFMDQHGIDISIVSFANPWLDFLSPPDAESLARDLNTDLEQYCATGPSLSSDSSLKRLYGLGLLPLVPGIPVSSVLEAISQISQASHLRGLIMGTRGLGQGLDDEALDPVWQAIEKAGLVVSAWGDKDNGHVLPLALGFPFETTTAITRLILSGAFDRFPDLRVLLAHSGGTLPQLSSRLASCIDHDPIVASRLKHDARFYLGKLWFDAVAYGPEELGFVAEVVSRAGRYETGSKNTMLQADRREGSKRMFFGTDHPFFPPLFASERWKSVVDNLEAINLVAGWGQEECDNVKGGNALVFFGLQQ
ncbi:amidohydrolase 2 [Rhodocollybia butyracea]|uniref:Amidohydrolase 2 n=1 Tax=Rhodocollybia butyracea TaxID=206335 RepID=A0A9P5Q5D9_9AGAR|nr:amidohydrolase 2 [Rhodocollybia butyracea]